MYVHIYACVNDTHVGVFLLQVSLASLYRHVVVWLVERWPGYRLSWLEFHPGQISADPHVVHIYVYICVYIHVYMYRG